MAQVRKIYDFKSVGQTQAAYDENVDDTAVVVPIGILTPVSFADGKNSMFAMSYSLEDQIRDNLRNLLATNAGERLMMEDLGANLLGLAFDLTAEDTDIEAARRISASVEKYMPYVALEDFEPSIEKSDDDNVIHSQIRITYSVPTLGLANQVVSVTIFTVG